MSTYSDSSLLLTKPHLDPLPRKVRFPWLSAGLITILLVIMAVAVFMMGAGVQKEAVSSSPPDSTRLLPTPTVTPSVRQYLEAEWQEIRSTIRQVEPPTSVGRFGLALLDSITWLFLLILLIVGLLLILNTLLVSLFVIEDDIQLARNSLLSSVIFLLGAGYLALYRGYLHWRGMAGDALRFIATICAIAGSLLGLLGLGIVLHQRQLLGQTLLYLTLAGVFPVSYIAYYSNVKLRNAGPGRGMLLPAASSGMATASKSPKNAGQEGDMLLPAANANVQPYPTATDTTTPQPVTVERLALDFLLSSPGVDPFDAEGSVKYEIIDVFKKKARSYYEKFYSWREYYFNIALTVLLTVIGLSLFFWQIPEELSFITPGTLSAMRFGFLGGYLFSVQLIYRRYTTNDLQPTVYLYSAQTLFAGAVFNYVAFQAISTLVTNQDEVIGEGALAIVAFAFGYFPLLAIRWFNRVSYQTLAVRQGQSEQMSLDLIDGINTFHETRLRDLGIDNIENLAAAELYELVTATPFGSQQIVDWIDQAILYRHLDTGKMEVFRGNSIRTASDLWRQWDATGNDVAKQEKLALQLQTSVESLGLLNESTRYGPNVAMVNAYWERKPREGQLAIALDISDVMIKAAPILKQYTAALEYAGNVELEMRPDQFSAQTIALQTAAELRELFRHLTGNLPPDPYSRSGELGLKLMYALAFQPETTEDGSAAQSEKHDGAVNVSP